MRDDTQDSNNQKTNKKVLTVFPNGFNLKKALASSQANQRISKQTQGGQANSKLPPKDGGIFLPVVSTDYVNSLSGGHKIKYRLCMNNEAAIPRGRGFFIVQPAIYAALPCVFALKHPTVLLSFSKKTQGITA